MWSHMHSFVSVCLHALACGHFCNSLCVCVFVFMYLRMCILSADWTRYLTANTTCCISGCLLPGKGRVEGVSHLQRACCWFSSKKVLCLSVKQHSYLPFGPPICWIVLFCVFVREWKDATRHFQLVKYCSQKGAQSLMEQQPVWQYLPASSSDALFYK